MAFVLHKKSKKIVEGISIVDLLEDGKERSIFDAIVSIGSEDYDFEQGTSNKNTFLCKSPRGQYNLTLVKIDGKVTHISCDCPAYKYSKTKPQSCKHGKALTDYLNQNVSIAGEVVKLKKRYARNLIDKLIALVHKEILYDVKYIVAGSYRRGKSDCKDLDIVIEGFKKSAILSRLQDFYPDGDKPQIGDKVKPAGSTASTKSKNMILRWYVPIMKDELIELDFHFCNPIEFEPTLLFYTGSKEFNLTMRAKAKSMGYALNEYGLWDRNNNKLLIAREEKEIFEALKMDYTPPEKR